MDVEEIESRISVLEKKKAELLEQIKVLNKRLRYKQYEHKALKPFVDQTRDVNIGPLKRQKNAMEFRISTQAYTPRLEREWLKEINKLEERLKEVREIEWARRKIRLVEKDITECEGSIKPIETELNQIRDELRRLYDDVRSARDAVRRAMKYSGPGDDLVTLGDIGIMENPK